MIRYLTFFFACCLLLTSCTNSSSTENKTENKPTVTNPSNATNAKYPIKTLASLQELYRQCTFIDFSFYELPVSMSFDNSASIQQILRLLSMDAPNITATCKPTGRAFFQRDGEDIAEAEFYLTEGCYYFVFFENNKPAYANLLTEEGITWYKNSLSRAFQQVQSR